MDGSVGSAEIDRPSAAPAQYSRSMCFLATRPAAELGLARNSSEMPGYAASSPRMLNARERR